MGGRSGLARHTDMTRGRFLQDIVCFTLNYNILYIGLIRDKDDARKTRLAWNASTARHLGGG